jgi:pyruvate dehydrogenase E2 component (dihydrolipoamide acetyltransferase)
MTSVFKLPLLGETMETGKVAQWLKHPGQSFRRGETIVEVETDKTTVEVPALSDGMMVEILAEAGKELKVGEPLCVIQSDEAPDLAAASDAAQAADEGAPPNDVTPRVTTEPSQMRDDDRRIRATPRARRLARQDGVDIAEVVGTGRRNRVEVRDVFSHALEHTVGAQEAAVDGGASRVEARGFAPSVAAAPMVDVARFGPVEAATLSRLQRISGPRLHSAWVNIPHVTHFDEADVTDLEAFRKRLDQDAKADKNAPYRVSLLPFLMKAAVIALKAFPAFNSVLSPTGDGLVRRLYWHIGFAVDTPDGLVVAVVRDVDRKGVAELAHELATLSGKAREGRLTPAELQGSTFTISSLGGIGGSGFTPIINAPEVAILGVARTSMWPVWDGKAFQPRLMLPLCLSYDHRVIDGATAARFTRTLCGAVEDVRRMLL